MYRLLEDSSLTPSAFDSYAALGKPCPPYIDACRFASCSLVLDTTPMKKLPKFKNARWAAKVAIPVGAGRSKQKGNHIDFWPYAGFSPDNVTIAVVGI
ncbi:MAG: hypothetical protein IE910_00700 [Brevundimonas sp.]|nr:hypothetical protein [Brevundimonas sp.]